MYNFIAHDYAYCLYGRATLIERVSLFKEEALGLPEFRGYECALLEEPLDSFHCGERRTIGDQYTWRFKITPEEQGDEPAYDLKMRNVSWVWE